MLDVKRKGNNMPVSRSGLPVATARAYSELPEPVLEPVSPVIHEVGKPAPALRQVITAPKLVSPHAGTDHQTKIPVIIGEAHFRGSLQIDGVFTGQLGGGGGTSTVRQTTRTSESPQPEMSGEINFAGMVRVNGHIAGSVYSKKGTLIVDATARVDANVEVAIAVISGTVNGDIVAHEKVEIGPNAKIYGNIWTRSLALKDGAIFEGVCRMIGEECND